MDDNVKFSSEFQNFVTLLKGRLHTSGCTKESQEKLQTARKHLEEKRRKFLRNKILYKIISDISMDPSCSMQTEIAEALTLAELSGSLELGSTQSTANSPGDKITTLAIDPQLIHRPPSNPQMMKVLKQNLEDRLFDTAKSLYLITSEDSDTELKASLLHPHLLRLHDKISDIVKSNKESSNEMKILNSNLDTVLRKQVTILTEMEKGLDKLINKHYAGSKLESSSVQVQYMRAKCETLRLKMKCLEMEIVNATYNKESIKAIKLVRTRMLEKVERSETELAALQNRIVQYRGVSSEFSDLVKEYAKILKMIEEKKWALRELTEAAPGAL